MTLILVTVLAVVSFTAGYRLGKRNRPPGWWINHDTGFAFRPDLPEGWKD